MQEHLPALTESPAQQPFAGSLASPAATPPFTGDKSKEPTSQKRARSNHSLGTRVGANFGSGNSGCALNFHCRSVVVSIRARSWGGFDSRRQCQFPNGRVEISQLSGDRLGWPLARTTRLAISKDSPDYQGGTVRTDRALAGAREPQTPGRRPTVTEHHDASDYITQTKPGVAATANSGRNEMCTKAAASLRCRPSDRLPGVTRLQLRHTFEKPAPKNQVGPSTDGRVCKTGYEPAEDNRQVPRPFSL